MEKFKVPFIFRGLRFREYAGGIGMQVYVPARKKWIDTLIFSRRTFEEMYRSVPAIGLWKGRTSEGIIRFKK